ANTNVLIIVSSLGPMPFPGPGHSPPRRRPVRPNSAGFEWRLWPELSTAQSMFSVEPVAGAPFLSPRRFHSSFPAIRDLVVEISQLPRATFDAATEDGLVPGEPDAGRNAGA